MYRARNKGIQILLSNSQAGRGRTVMQEHEEISRNHVQAFIPGSVQGPAKRRALGCVNPSSWLRLAACGNFTQRRAHLLADPCIEEVW